MAATYDGIIRHVASALGGIDKIPGYHYDAPAKCQIPYIVWCEDSAGHMYADDDYAEKYLDGTIDMICRTGDDVAAMADIVEDACRRASIVVDPGDILRDRDSGLTRWTWSWRCSCDG